MPKEKMCSSCRAGEIEEPADYLVRGRVPSPYGDRMIPYRAHLCRDHLLMLEEDGAELRIVAWLSIRALRERLPDLWSEYERMREEYREELRRSYMEVKAAGVEPGDEVRQRLRRLLTKVDVALRHYTGARRKMEDMEDEARRIVPA